MSVYKACLVWSTSTMSSIHPAAQVKLIRFRTTDKSKPSACWLGFHLWLPSLCFGGKFGFPVCSLQSKQRQNRRSNVSQPNFRRFGLLWVLCSDMFGCMRVPSLQRSTVSLLGFQIWVCVGAFSGHVFWTGAPLWGVEENSTVWGLSLLFRTHLRCFYRFLANFCGFSTDK